MNSNLEKIQINSSIISYGDGIYAVDSGYIRKEFAAIHLIIESDKVAIVDTGTNHSIKRVLEALDVLKIDIHSLT